MNMLITCFLNPFVKDMGLRTRFVELGDVGCSVRRRPHLIRCNVRTCLRVLGLSVVGILLEVSHLYRIVNE